METERAQEIEFMAAQLAERLWQRGSDVPILPRLLDVDQAAVYLSRTPKAVNSMIQRGRLPVTQLDGRRQIDRLKLDELIADKTYYLNL